MTVLRCQVSLTRDTHIPADIVMNTWHFMTVGLASPSSVADSAAAQLETWYGDVDTFLAQYLAASAQIDVYDLQDAEPRVPILTTNFTITTGSGVGLPAEVAICVSYRGQLISGTNPARRRGRIYLGPLDADVLQTGSNDCTITDSVRNALVTTCENLITSGQTEDARWVVFSPTSAGGPPWTESVVENASVDVSAGWIDNAFDTVRSRGSDPTIRTLFEVTPP